MIKLGRLFGIKLGLHPTALVLALIAGMNFFGFLLVKTNDQLFSYVGSTIFGLGMLASILFHELGHALMGMKFGMTCRYIILNLLGGVALINSNFTSPKSEFWVAMAGPVVSFVLGVLLFLPTIFLPEFRHTDANLVFAGLAVMNVFLAIFNLIPAFPLDGGRVLRSIIWKVTNNFEKATKISAYSGYAFGGFLIVSGVLSVCGIHVPIFGGNIISAVWNLVIGLFVVTAARSESQSC